MTKPHVPHTLLPLFGVRCRSQSFAYVHPNSGTEQFVHFVAYRDNANEDKWVVQRVTETGNSKTGGAWYKIDVIGQHLAFDEAMTLIAQYESYHRGNTQGFTPLFPDAAALGFAHFRAFAEREGYVFDINGKPHPRPAPDVLPGNAEFSAEAIASANKHCQRPREEFALAAPSRKLPDTLFLFDAFNRKAIGKKQGNELATMRVLNLMDTFVRHIDTFNTQMLMYRDNYTKADSHLRIASAEQALTQARHQLRQMNAYGVDTSAFEKLTQECAIIGKVAQAQSAYDRLRRQLGNFDDLEALFKSRAHDALRLYEELNRSDPAKDKDSTTRYAEGYTALQEMMIQGGAPTIPAAIGQFVCRYREQRAQWIAPPANGVTPPKPPSP